jgi:hypothetical protein
MTWRRIVSMEFCVTDIVYFYVTKCEFVMLFKKEMWYSGIPI